MKKCPKCEERYDDSWGVCIKCNTKLESLSDIELTGKEKDFEKKQKEKEIRLKQDEEYAKKYSASRIKIITALIIDLFFVIVLVLPLIFILTLAKIILFGFGDLIVAIVFCLIYFVFSEYIFGKTIGKAIMKLKIIVADGTKPSLKTLFIRELNGWNFLFFYEKNSRTVVINDRK